MKIVERLDAWTGNLEKGWLKKYALNKTVDWKLYKYVKNAQAPSNTGIDLSSSKLLLISSAGAYLPAQDRPFNAKSLLGDYSIRTFPLTSSLSDLDYAHDHYDQEAVRRDAQVLLPLEHLQDLVDEQVIGSLSNKVISFMGYQPFVNKVVKKTIPAILRIVKAEAVDAALLVPS